MKIEEWNKYNKLYRARLKIVSSKEFDKWFDKIKSTRTKEKIIARIKRIVVDKHFGDYRYLRNDIYELRVHWGPGYRIYFSKIADKVIVLLIGGDKQSQKIDIEKAIVIKSKYRHGG